MILAESGLKKSDLYFGNGLGRYLGIMRCLSSTFSKMRFSVWYLSSHPLIANFSKWVLRVFWCFSIGI